ncbi:MBL fold metallo-hydrolase [Natroniella sp. ANB-PHB2]|uniref:MBL fold metallo-hydrolase n=1 Tax=Natroniella sp. ANB-PHB2 TaxID=3384444 RepID=UPI0038D36A43
MVVKENVGLNYEEPIEIAEGVYWVGFLDKDYSLHCNPYLIVEGSEAILIDGGSRTDFSSVMMKILQTGIQPSDIKNLIYQHYDPDLCGSIPDFEEIIDNNNLSIISHRENNIFIKYYGGSLRRRCIEGLDFEWEFSSGRKLKFIRTPYAHSPGSFVTFDEKTGVLFSSDLFGSYAKQWDLFLELDSKCYDCYSYKDCSVNKNECPILGIIDFHINIMTSKKALTYALNRIKELPVQLVAPQHGSVIADTKSINSVICKLEEIDNIGIDNIF